MIKNVIVADAHYRAAVSVMRELCGCGAAAAWPEGEPKPLSAYSNCCQGGYALKGDFADALLRLAGKRSAVIFSCGARSLKLMAERREEFAPFALISDAETLKNANDKTYVANTARKIGIRAPRTLDTSDPDGIEYPVITKYVDGEALGKKAADRYKIAKSPKELRSALEHMGSHPVFTSEYIRGSGFGVSVLMDRNRRPVRVFCHERLREYPLSGGPSVMCRSVWNEKMARDAVKLLGELDFEGLAMVEFKGAPDDYALLEINPRVWGSYPLAHLAGAGFAEAYALAASGETLPEATGPRYKLGVKMQFFISGARWARAAAKNAGSPAPGLRYAGDIFNPKIKHGLWSWRDMRPGFIYMKDIIGKGTR
ncbi:MAG: ATP-grasp domain-containing protein [Clostridiales bacterium]|nr:ATP-grasp domain-containing protein [Clostridiales bacterium]